MGNVLREREQGLFADGKEARWREKEPSSVIKCEQETVPVRNGAGWREIKQREHERTAVEESKSWNVDMWTSATADLVWPCDGVDGEWSGVTGNHEALAQSGFQADQWVADMWVTLSAAESQWATLICLRVYLKYIFTASVFTWTLVISCSLHFDLMQRSLLTISHRNRPL